MKKFIKVLIVLFSLVLVGCNSGNKKSISNDEKSNSTAEIKINEEVIDRFNSANWVSADESGAISFSTAEPMNYVMNKNNEIVKAYESENMLVIFTEQVYTNHSKKSNITVEMVKQIFQKQISDIFNVEPIMKITKNSKDENLTDIRLTSDIDFLNVGEFYAYERSTDITFLTIFHKISKNSKLEYTEFEKELTFNKD